MSMVFQVNNDQPIEIATIGKEGMVGTPVLLGVRECPSLLFCQISGTTFKMTIQPFLDLVEELPVFKRMLNLYSQALFNQVGQTVACNRYHSLCQRTARWLLMSQDRVADNR